MSAKSLVKWKNGFRVFPKVLSLRKNTEPIDIMPTEPSWKSLQTIPSNLKLRES